MKAFFDVGEGGTDSTIAHPKTSDILLRIFYGCSTQGRILLNKKYLHIVFCVQRPIDR